MAGRARQEDVVTASELNWTLIWPTRLTDGAATGRVRLGADLRATLRTNISRADVAQTCLPHRADRHVVSGRTAASDVRRACSRGG